MLKQLLKQLGFTLLIAGTFSASLAFAKDAENAILFSADLSNAQPGTSPSPLPFYAKQCAKLPPPGSMANAAGKATLLYFPKTKTLKYFVAYTELSGPAMMAHIHSSATSAGPIVQTFCGIPPPDEKGLGHSGHDLNGKHCPTETGSILSGEYKLKGNPSLQMTPEQEEQQLMNGQLYINFHTCLNMLGEIKGNIVKVTPGSK